MRRLAWLVVLMVGLLCLARPALADVPVELVTGLPLGQAAYGLAIGPDGLLYVGDIGGPQGTIYVFTPTGQLRDRIVVPPGPTGMVALRGMVVDGQGNLYVADLANGERGRGRVIRVSARGRQSVLAAALSGPTGLALDRDGVVYVANALDGTIRWIGPDGTSAVFVDDGLLAPRGPGELGASGMVFANDGSALYISNPSTDRLLRLAINADGSAGRLTLLADGGELRSGVRSAGLLEGPEGLAVDGDGNVLVAARSDEIDLISPRGRVLGRLPSGGGSVFSGPTTLALSGRYVYVANLGLKTGLSFIARYPLAALLIG